MEPVRVMLAMPLLLIGCVLAATGLVLLRRSLLYTAMATVQDVAESTADGKTTYAPLLQFTTRDNQKTEFRAPTSPARYEVGERVSVIYDPTFPTIAQMASPVRLWIIPALCAVVGLALAITGAMNLSALINSLAPT